MLKQTLPVPITYYIGNMDGYRFSIMQFMSGITLRDLLLSNCSYNISAIMIEVGFLLAKIASIEIPSAGFFNNAFNVT